MRNFLHWMSLQFFPPFLLLLFNSVVCGSSWIIIFKSMRMHAMWRFHCELASIIFLVKYLRCLLVCLCVSGECTTLFCNQRWKYMILVLMSKGCFNSSYSPGVTQSEVCKLSGYVIATVNVARRWWGKALLSKACCHRL